MTTGQKIFHRPPLLLLQLWQQWFMLLVLLLIAQQPRSATAFHFQQNRHLLQLQRHQHDLGPGRNNNRRKEVVEEVRVHSRKAATTATALRMSAGIDAQTAYGQLKSLQDSLFQSINERLALKMTDFSEYNGVQTWQLGQASFGETEWWDETMGSKLTGVAKYSACTSAAGAGAAGGTGTQAFASIDAWMGPSVLTPHLALSLGYLSESGFYLETDYVPRGAVCLGSDSTYLDSFYGPQVQAKSYTPLAGFPSLPPPGSFEGRLLRSPIYIAPTALSIEQVQHFASIFVQRWLAWIDEAQPVDARQRGAINARDDKLRQFAFRANCAKYASFLSAEGTAAVSREALSAIAIASTGPISEAYIGGGS